MEEYKNIRGRKVLVWGEAEQKTIDQMFNCLTEDSSHGILLGDNHYGYSMPVGGVVAYKDHISVSGVGYDIACVDGDTEFLSPNGWVKIKDYNGEQVMQYNTNGTGKFVTPIKFIKNDDNIFYHLKTKYGVDQMVTADHDLFIYPIKSDKETLGIKIKAEEFVSRHNKLKLGMYANFETAFKIDTESTCPLSDEEIRVQIMSNADGYIAKNRMLVSVKKLRKILRAEYLLQDAGIEYTKKERSNGYTDFRFTAPIQEKTYEHFWGCNYEQLKVINEESLYWDGNIDTPCFYTSKEEEADFMQFAYTATGYRAAKRFDVRKDGSVEYRVFRYDKAHIGMRSSPKKNIKRVQKHGEKSYCFTTDSGLWISRRNGQVVVTGNCGNKAIKTDICLWDIDNKERWKTVNNWMDEIWDRVSFGMGRKNNFDVDHPILDEIAQTDFKPQKDMLDLAAKQLGTVGGGNHYVDLFRDEDGYVWVGVHFGSRGFGHKTATGFIAVTQGKNFGDKATETSMDSPPDLLDIDSESGQAYIEAMRLAGKYAYAGRDVVCDVVLDILGAESTFSVHNHHNYCIYGEEIIPTPSGPVRMKEISVGDYVYGINGDGICQSKVIDHWSSGNKKIYKINAGVREIKCSETHPILTANNGNLEWVSAGNLRKNDIIICAESFYPEAKSVGEDLARFTGAFLGDGWIRQNTKVQGYSLGLAIGTGKDTHTGEYLELAKRVMPTKDGQIGWEVDRAGHFGLSCSSKLAWLKAQSIGLAAKGKDKRVPEWVFSTPRNEKLAFLAGFIDADGSIYNENTSNHGRCKIVLTNEDLLIGVREIAISCGLHVTSIISSQRKSNFPPHIYTCWSFDIASLSTNEIPTWHESKSNNKKQNSKNCSRLTPQYLNGAILPQNTFARRIRSIEIIEEEEVFDITVDNDTSSFVANGVVTHNCWRENHHGEDIWVIRKGATPAFKGQLGFVGGSMGDISVILEGTQTPEESDNFCSTVHGAGRIMSRTKAAGKKKKRWTCMNRDCDWYQGQNEHKPEDSHCPKCGHVTIRKIWQQVLPAQIDFPAVQQEIKDKGIILKGAGADEAPGVYKHLPEVLQAHYGQIKVLHTLKPIGVAMAGPDTRDDYKD